MKRKYKVIFEVRAEIELDNEVLKSVDDEWQKIFIPITDDNDIIEYIAYNMLCHHLPLSQIEGFMMPDNLAILNSEHWFLDSIEEE